MESKANKQQKPEEVKGGPVRHQPNAGNPTLDALR